MEIWRLQQAVITNNWQTCECLLRKNLRGVDLNAPDKKGWTLLHYIVVRGHGPTVQPLVQLMLECGADPNIKCPVRDMGNINAFDICVFNNVSPTILELLLRGRTDSEALELRACAHLLIGDLERALAFFSGDERVFTVPELFVRFVQIVKRRIGIGLVQEILIRVLLRLPRLEAGEYLAIVSYLFQDKDFSYYVISLLVSNAIGRYLTPNIACDLLDIICVSPLDQERQPDFLYNISIIDLIQHVLHSAQKDELVSRLQIAINGFEDKNQLLIQYHVLNDPILVRFLLESCGCEPNGKNGDGDSALHDLLRNTDVTTIRKIEVALILLDNGTHPCLRNAQGVPAFKLLSELGVSVGVRTLQCITASKIAEANIEFQKYLPIKIHKFVELHY